jgi:hypothetical protein
MRDYSKISPNFWIGKTGKQLRAKGLETQFIALYLLTSPDANMIGLYYCPLVYIAHQTGLDLGKVETGLQGAIDAGFCQYDKSSEIVWVIEMARYQVAASLQGKDNRIAGVQNAYSALPDNPYLGEFFDHYKTAFCMTQRRSTSAEYSPSKAPLEPLQSQEQEQEQEQEKIEASASVASKLTTQAPQSNSQLPCPVEEIVAVYHQLMPLNPRCKILNAARRKSIRARWLEASLLTCDPFGYTNREDGLKAWHRFFEIANKSKFLTGKSKPLPEKPPFIADIDFLMAPSSFAKCLENKYHRDTD